jgi:Gpi18-like mannosyltransferase
MKSVSVFLKDFGTKYKTVLLIFLFSRIFILVTAIVGFSLIGRDLPSDHPLWKNNTPSENIYLRMWERWDANHYLNIAKDGYTHNEDYTNLAFFPLYPYLGKVLSYVVGNTTLSLLLVSNIAFFFALIFLSKLLSLEYESKVVNRTLLYISVSPFSFFFFGVYTESLLLLTLVMAVYYIRKENYYYAAFWGIMLTATKLIGIVIIPFALWEYYLRNKNQVKKIGFDIIYIPLMGLGLLAYMLHNQYLFGDFLINFESSRGGWVQYLNWPWVSFTKHINRIISGKAFQSFYFDISFALLAIYLCIAGLKKLRSSYSLLNIFLVMIPISSNTLKSFSRFMVIIFPLFLVMALIVDNEKLHRYFTAFSLLALAINTILFVNFYPV